MSFFLGNFDETYDTDTQKIAGNRPIFKCQRKDLSYWTRIYFSRGVLEASYFSNIYL